jgi:hypothetical protein
MKLGVALFTALIVACSSSTPPAHHTVVDSRDYTPPTDCEANHNTDGVQSDTCNDMQLKERQRQEREAQVSEQKAYDDSLEKITQTIRDEGLLLQMCNASGTKKECAEMLASYCKVDMLIDSRGGHWHKPYCK